MPSLAMRGRSVVGSGRNWLRDRAVTLSGDGYRPTTVYTPPSSSGHPMERGSPAKTTLSPKGKKGRRIVEESFHEVHADEPEIVAKTRRKQGAAAANRQRTAIALSKARQRGVRIPER